MITAHALAELLIAKFDPKRSEKLVVFIAELLREGGTGKFRAEILTEELMPAVQDILRRQRAEDLPFFILEGDAVRLLGKGRERPVDTPETVRARQARVFVSKILQAIYDECRDRDDQFEVLCASCLRLSGARETFATCSSDDGGIDVYGRLLIRTPDLLVTPGLLQTTLLEREVLILGQCKCDNPVGKIGPESIREFHGAVAGGLNKYEGNQHPPTHRVPSNYYQRNELCIPIFMTTADYSDKAATEAKSQGIVIISGQQIAEFVAYCGIGFADEGGVYQFKPDLFQDWLRKQIDTNTSEPATS